MRTKRILAALRKCKAALERHQHFGVCVGRGYIDSTLRAEGAEAITEAATVLADWQAETLKKSEAFR